MDLVSHKFFQSLAPEAAASLLEQTEIFDLPAGGDLFQEGAAPDGVYLVLEGQIDLIKVAADGVARTLAASNAGDYFGEMGVFDGNARSTGARAAVASRLARVPSGPLLTTLNETPGRSAMAFMYTLLDHPAPLERALHERRGAQGEDVAGRRDGEHHHPRHPRPFQSVQLASELLLIKHDDPETKDICDMISAQIARVSVMAEELLEFSRGTPKLTLEVIDLAALMKEFQFLNRDMLNSAKIPVEFASEPILVQVDKHKMIRTIQNILNNAVEALKQHRPADGKVIITAGPVADHAEIRIIDNGPGIPESIREKLFEPFVTHGKKNGTGLGMAIVKSVVGAHNGNLFFETETGKGTTFVIQLPKVVAG